MDKNENNIERSINSLDSIERVGPRPFFSSRAINRMKSTASDVSPETVFSLRLITVLTIIIISANIYLSSISLENTYDSGKSVYEFASDYGLEVKTIYDQEL